MNISDLLAIPLHDSPDKVALSFSCDGLQSEYTCKELDVLARRMANVLAQKGVGNGDRVALFLSNRPEFVIAFLAILKAGAIAIPINLRYRRIEIGHILRDCEPRLLISEKQYLTVLNDANISESSVVEIVLVDDFENWRNDSANFAFPTVSESDLASIIYTSGTTGASKGAMLTHSNILATITALKAAWAWRGDDCLLLCLPLYHVHGLFVGLLTGLASGAEIMLRAGYDRDSTVDELINGRQTLFFAVPTIYVRIVDTLRSMQPADFSHMRLFCSGSAALSSETHTEFHELTGHRILERYGMTETGMNLSNPYAGERRAGTVGTPLPGVEIRIVDGNYVPVPAGEEGELLVRGSNVFSGYWQAPEKTSASFVTDAMGQQWFCTGDLARKDPVDGYVTLLGRRHELIISGGFNIYPREIEEVLDSFPGIKESAVVGQSHPEWGEVPIAYIACGDGVDDAALIAYCRQNLASFKAPSQIHRLDELPRNAMGKLQKHLLPRS